MDEEFKKRLADYFEPWELTELLGIDIMDVIEAFSDKIEENYDMLQEYIYNGE
jgi:hypothetical protein